MNDASKNDSVLTTPFKSGADDAGVPGKVAMGCWALVLVVASLGGCIQLACLMPFAALAVALAATLKLRHAIAAMVVIWLLNQAVGFGLYHFPHTFDTIGWGVMIGVAAVLSTVTAWAIIRQAAFAPKPIRVVVGFFAAFAVYELILLAATPVLGGLATFTPTIVATIGLENALWLAGLVVLNELLALAVRPWLGASALVARAS